MKNIAIGNETHRDLKIYAAEHGLTLSASVKLLLAGWNKHFPVSNLDASHLDVAKNAISATGESTENVSLPPMEPPDGPSGTLERRTHQMSSSQPF